MIGKGGTRHRKMRLGILPHFCSWWKLERHDRSDEEIDRVL